ncbi:phosphoribosylglycinamide formyltransferase [Alphaproteobacteria bacterium LSUCC0684]
MPLRLGILISGRGSNMLALLDYAAQDETDIEVAVVLADGDAPGLDIAAARGIATANIPRLNDENRKNHESRLIAKLESHGAELICLAGFMRLVSAEFCARFDGRLINIHPSLLPKHKGLDTHEKALADGDREHGCSVHLVTPGMDEGPVLGQRRVEVLENDTSRTLADRVLAEEHRLYPLVVGAIAAGLLSKHEGRYKLNPGAIKGRIEGLPFPLKWPAD